MQKKIRCVFITILAILAIMVMASSRVEATTVKVSPSKTMYTINGNTRMYRYKESSGTYNNIYCLDYCGTLNSGSYYTMSSDIYNLTNDQIIELFGSVENYNKVLWVIDNMFLSEDQSSDEMIAMIDQLKQVLHTDIAKNAIKEKYNLSSFSNESMDTAINHVYQNKWYNVFYSIQQCVLWNYTTNTEPFQGLTKIYGGYSLDGKYYNWMYTGLKAVADTKGNYSSPNKNSNGVSSMLNSLTMDSSNANVDLQSKKIGPFVINGYNKEVITKKNYEVKINGTKLETSDYTITFDGTNIYITITNSNIDLSNVKVDISVNLIGVETNGNIFYKQKSQDIVYLKKNTTSRKLNGTTEDTEFDLRLLKNIEAVWSVDKETSTEKYNIDKQDDILKTRKLKRMSTLNKGNTTEIWYTNKYPVNVATGDIVKYAITISNEGSLDGYATKVTDYIADGLELVSKEELIKLGILNNNDEYYGWTKGNSENGFTEISTTYLSDKQIKAYNKESDTLDTKVIYIYCKVTSSKTGALLKNIAEIAADKTTNISGQDVDDRDSTPGSLKMTDLSNNWKGNKGNSNIESTDINKKYTYAGNEDDDDFETVKVQNFDMALTKQITSVKYSDNSSIELDRLIDINKSDLNNANATKTTASYNMNKSIVNVTNNSIITYRIYVYNEGDINGYAKKITDYLPKGLEFYSGDVNGVNYNWSVASVDNGTTIISTDYLANTCIYAYKNNTLSSAYVEVQCKVTSNNVDEILTNVAEITDYGYYINNTYVQNQKESKLDRDSVQDSVKENASSNEVSNMIKSYENNVKGLNKDLEYLDKNDTDYEDDDDFEWVKISNKELDLALRKSISAVNGNAIVNGYNLTENRLPKVNSASVAAALSTGNAEYYHNKEYITVNVDDEITYTIRVYNEGSADDYYGYAKTITDYLPNGLTFVRIDNSSTDNWTTTSKQGDTKVVLDYTGNKILMSDSLSKIAENNNNSDLYQTVSIVCKVNNVTGDLTNRAEITSEVATDENGNIVEGIKDRDSTPGSLTSDILKLETYYKDYNRKYGINDTYIDYYPGEENGKKEDDIDFETVYVEEIEKVEISGTKTWNDNGNQDGKRPEKIRVYLLADGDVIANKVISEAEGWKYSFTNLDKYKNGKEIVYTIDESEIENYTKKIEGYNLINTYNDDTPEKIEVNGTKIWNDNGNKGGKRPEKITVYLLADGERADSKEISEATGWKYSFTNLDKYKNGKEIVYTIDESEIENYTKTIEGYNLINTYNEDTPEKVEVNGTKTWNDNGNKEGKRPKNIIVNLFADGVKIDSTIVVEGTDGTWKYSFTNLDKQKDGKDIVYTITEEPVEYYESKIEGYNITNKYNEKEPEKISISGQKTWKDENNKDQIRPKVLRVYLLADGVRIDSVLVTSANNWKYSFENLDKTKNGKEIKYTIDEENISGYEKTVDGYNLINTHIVKPTVDFSLRKFITDVNEVNVEPSRAPQVDIIPLVNGTSTTATYTHPKNAILVNTGDVVTYTLRVYNEGEISGYASLIKDDIPDGLEFIPNNNTNKQYLWEMLDANGNKVTDVSKAKYVVSNYLSKEVSEDNLIKAFDKNTSKELDYKEVKVSFKVISIDTTGKELINYAQISKETDSEGNSVKDRDSTPDKWIDGEDDQDIEKVKLTYLDLSLRKFITKIDDNEVTPNRAPEVDVSKLKDGSSTTATYNHPKDVVNVSKDNIVVYTLRIYNEGSKAGCATLVKDDIPTGLQYLPSNEINKKYNWKMLDESGNETTDVSKAKYVVTDYLANDIIKAFNPETMETLDYRDVQVAFKVIAPETSKDIITNYAQISEEKDSNGNDVKDRDSTPDKWVNGEDDQDTEKIKLTYADLSLRKFITEVNNSAVNPSRAPEVDVTPLVNETGTTAIYNHPKEPVNVQENDIVTYTLRIYNEGTKSVYANLVKDDIPDGLEFIVDNEINRKYNWKMLDESGNEVTDVTKAKYIVTDYLANDIIKAFDPTTMKTLDYKDVKVSFKVKATTEKDKIITNYAQISKEKDSNGNDVKDRDSTPDKWVDGEDDQDTEKIKVKYFDLSLQKWVSKVIVIEDGKEKVTKTGYNGEQDSEPVVKVDLKKSKISNVIVKFEYQIRVTNEGQIPGYATEVSDYIPNGLKFNKEDNVNWVESGDKVTTNALENTLLQPGESTTVSIVLTWINGSDNLGLKTNIAEISEDADKDKKDVTDIDSTPNNKKDGEDDIDDAPVILTIKTGETPMYIGLTIGIISILGVGIYSIKKYVLK